MDTIEVANKERPILFLKKKERIPFFLMLLILIAAFFLRCQGIWFGYPLPVHPDEPRIVNAALNTVRTGDLNPHFFLYPTLYIYLQAALYAIIAFLEKLFASVPLSGIPEIKFYIYGRVLNVFLSTVTIYITYEIGRRLFNAWTGLAATFFISASYLHITNSFTVTVDSSVALWSSLATLMAVMIYTKGSKRWYYIVAGISAGLAIGSKYTAFPAVLPMIIAHFYQVRHDKQWHSMDIIIGLLVVPAAFILTSPYAVVDYKTFIKALIIQRNEYSRGHPGAESLTNSSFSIYFKTLFTEGYGIMSTVLALGGLFFLMIKDSWKTLLLLSFPLLLFLFVGAYKTFFPRNVVAVVPFLSLFSGFCIYVFVELSQQCLSRLGKLTWQRGTIFVLGASLVFTSVYGQIVHAQHAIREMTLPDTRWVGLQWIIDNLPPGVRIGRESYAPPIETYSDKFQVTNLFGLVWLSKQTKTIEKVRTLDFMILSSGNYARFVDHPDIYPWQAGIYNTFFAENILIKEFAPDGKTMGGPTIRIFKIKR